MIEGTVDDHQQNKRCSPSSNLDHECRSFPDQRHQGIDGRQDYSGIKDYFVDLPFVLEIDQI
jgi:hypothetical protein